MNTPNDEKRREDTGNRRIDIKTGDISAANGMVNVAGGNIIQNITNFLRGETGSETIEMRNRRTLLNHVENFWIKGILEKSLHGAALLELGIKEERGAVYYPLVIQREATHETLPAGLSMLAIFQEIGLGRSLLILGAPGAGKTTMLLELTRLLIECARRDLSEPIPMVFNLSSWTEKQSLADWLAVQLNEFYHVSRKEAPVWIGENRLFLLLDGLDEVRADIRPQCVEAINRFRQQQGLISLVVCSRSQEYADLNRRLALDGAIEIQPLTARQVYAYFERFEGQLAGVRQLLERDDVLREMAETPLFLSIMTLAYRGLQSADIPASENVITQCAPNIPNSQNAALARTHLFDTYIERMFERPERAKTERFEKRDVLRWLSWLAGKMIEHSQVPYLLERMQPGWLSPNALWWFKVVMPPLVGLLFGLVVGAIYWLCFGPVAGLSGGLIFGLMFGWLGGMSARRREIRTIDSLTWSWKVARAGLRGRLKSWLVVGSVYGLLVGLIGIYINGSAVGLVGGLIGGLIVGLMYGLRDGLQIKQVEQIARPGQRLSLSVRSSFLIFLAVAILFGLSFGMVVGPVEGVVSGLMGGLFFGLFYGGKTILQHYTLRWFLNLNGLLPWRLVPFLDYATELIFLRRVGGGYIFIHRMLMEHFAAMVSEGE